PGHVRARVRSDYEARLSAVTEELRAHAESARQAIEEKRHLRGELQKKETRAGEKLTEAELRHSVGEYDEGQWTQVHADILAELVSVREDLQSVEADLQKLEELDALVRNKPVPPPPRAVPTSAPAAPPARAPRAPPHAPPQPEAAAHEDALAFIKSVTEGGHARGGGGVHQLGGGVQRGGTRARLGNSHRVTPSISRRYAHRQSQRP